MAGLAESRLHSAYLLNVKRGRKVLPVDPSHQRQLFRVPVAAAGGGPRSVPTQQRLPRPHRQRDTARFPSLAHPLLPAQLDPVTPGAIFRGCLSLGRRGHGGAGLSCARALSRSVYRPPVLRWRDSPASGEMRRQPPCGIAADGLRKRRTSPSLQRGPMRSDQRKVFGSDRHPNHPQIIYTAGCMKCLVVRGVAA